MMASKANASEGDLFDAGGTHPTDHGTEQQLIDHFRSSPNEGERLRERGFFTIDRRVWNHPLFAREKFSEREAWFWLISSAAWAEIRVRIGKSIIDLKRGQCAFATRFLADKWLWAHSKVVRYLNRLRSDTMIDTEPKREATLITICNYDQYQLGRNADETQTETPMKHKPERQRNKEEEINKQEKKDAAIAASDLESDLFRRGKEILGKTAGGLIKQLLTAKDGKVNLARAAVETAAEKENPREYIGAIIRNRDPPKGEASRYVDPRL